jgi:S-adenosylmethionine hydrolase
MEQAVITLTTDFGTDDAYVAAMKGVIIGINPKATLVDISHNIEPQNLVQAAFVLGTACPHFPGGTIHVIVVDPGVGTSRRAIILSKEQAVFVAPDNGVLGHIIGATSSEGHFGQPQLVELPSGLGAWAITDPKYWRHPVSPTFHGRDIFAPVAAHLSLGVPLGAFGEAISRVYALSVPVPSRSDEEIIGCVLHIDHFGNIITSLQEEDLPLGRWRIEVGGRRIENLSGSYEAAGSLGALPGSSGYVEIAARSGNAARQLGVRVGDKVTVKKGVRSK